MERLSQQTYREVENRRYFDRWSKHYDDGRISRWFQYTQELTIRLLDLKPDSKVLDVGCGTGHAVLQLASIVSAGKACGIDVSPGMVEKASSKVPQELKEIVEFVQASSEDIPYPNGQFNHVLCTNSFHHYPDPLRALGEMRRVLKPGGQIVIFENAPDLSWYTWVWDRILRVAETGHVRYYASWEIGQMLGQAGFDNVRLRHLRNEFLKHGKIFASIQVWSATGPGGKQSKMKRRNGGR
jgi:ubiquinone/menaquinone biosynthesis C-methylase UbiE